MTTKRKPEDRGKAPKRCRPWVRSRTTGRREQPFISQHAIKRQYREYHRRWALYLGRKRGVKVAVAKRDRRER